MIDLTQESNREGTRSIFLTHLPPIQKKRNKQVASCIRKHNVPSYAHIFLKEGQEAWYGRILWHVDGPCVKPEIDGADYRQPK